MESHLAYLDAGSGSLIVQALVAGTAGVVVAAKLYWRRLTSVFRRKTPAEASAAPGEDVARAGAARGVPRKDGGGGARPGERQRPPGGGGAQKERGPGAPKNTPGPTPSR